MTKTYFEVIRPGINSTFQDMGRNNLYHIGIPFSGAMDNRNYILSNRLVENNLESPVLEFAYQGPLLRYRGDKINIAITGDVNFTLKKNAAYSKFISLYPRYVFDTVLILSIIFILIYQKNIELGNLAIFFFGSQKLLPLLQLVNSSFTAIKYGAAQTKDFLSIIKDVPNLKKSKRVRSHKNKNKN